MGKDNIIVLYRPTRTQRFFSRLASLAGWRIIEWANPAAPHRIAFPPSAAWTPIMEDARARLARYSRAFWQHAPDVFVLDYVRKSFDLIITDYVAFQRACEGQVRAPRRTLIHPRILSRIVAGLAPVRTPFFWIAMPMVLLKFLLLVVRALLLSIRTKETVAHPDVLFVRKKIYPDLSVSEQLGAAVRAEGKIFLGAFLSFGRARARYGFYFLNVFRDAPRLVVRAAIRVFGSFARDAYFFYRCGLSARRFSAYLSHAFHAALLMSFSTTTVIGALVDKPMFVLLARYKQPQQQLVGINEFFSFYPYRGFDYNHLDVYYSMNTIDAAIQNEFGGHIAETRLLPFFRHKNKSTSKGISSDLARQFSVFPTRVLATTSQIATTGYSPWSADELNSFLTAIEMLACAHADRLYIIKGKKGELGAVERELLHRLEAKPNVYLIHSDTPRMLAYNQFEDLVGSVQLLISMAHPSTTIWQALARDIPAIAVNDVHPRSFLSEYPHVEVRLAALADAEEYWLAMSGDTRARILRPLKQRVNITEEDAFSILARDLTTCAHPL